MTVHADWGFAWEWVLLYQVYVPAQLGIGNQEAVLLLFLFPSLEISSSI